MLLIYSPQSSTRLQYICKFIFEEVLATSYSLTTDKENFQKYNGSKLNYSTTNFVNTFQLIPHNLLFETGIKSQQIDCINEGEKLFFFKTAGANYPFDIFAASFYLLSRYEEYLPHTQDMYGRYAHENSLAYKEKFLHLPLINVWLQQFKEVLLQQFPLLNFNPKPFSFTPTYDIDIAWSYKQKGLLRNIGGFLKSPSINRLTTLFGSKNDPYDSYDFLHSIHHEFNLRPIYFFLVAKQNSVYDKNILPGNKAMQQLIKVHAEKYKIGLHPSWSSYNKQEIIQKEKNTLQNIAEKTINISRQHYIKLNLPETYSHLVKAGLTDDYSMGYGSINGFRASTASSFNWYDLSAEKITTLRVHSFCFMDGNCFYEQKLSLLESAEALMEYYQVCKKVNGEFITIFHNDFLGTDIKFAGWKEMYIEFLSKIA
jgi:hypothetical protein